MIDVKTSVGTRGSDSLLHSLSSGLWYPHHSLECPISFSPFLPFGTLGNTAGNGGVFLFINHNATLYLLRLYANTYGTNLSWCASPNHVRGITIVFPIPAAIF